MSAGLQLALLGGALVGLGVAVLVWRLLPAQPDLADALARIAPSSLVPPGTTAGPLAPRASADSEPDGRERLGVWLMRAIPVESWSKPPVRQLAILRMTPARFYGEKAMFALVGLAAPPVLSVLFTLVGLPVPFVVPVFASVALAGAMFFLPDYNVHDDAKKARLEFARALTAYVDLVALERAAGSGPRQAMENAATVGGSWVFHRLGEELARSRWSGLAPWDALRALSDELALPELADLADIMRLSGGEGAQVYEPLRARAAGMRTALQTRELAHANEVGERMSIPMSLLGVIFMAILIGPALLRILAAS